MASVLSLRRTVNHISSADHIIALGSTGEIIEQGSFAALSSAGGYVYGLHLQGGATTVSGKEAPVPLDDAAIVMATNPKASDRRAGDLTTYMYYVDMVGRLNCFIFVAACTIFVFTVLFPRESIARASSELG
jgi:ATP-binding cassette, subfamily C (CFTR/MRP), member 1